MNHDVLYLPARTKTLVQISIENHARSAGYIPRINAGPGLFVVE